MEKSNSLKVTWLKPEKVKPYPGNPRRISDQAVSKVSASLKRFGWRQPIVVDKDHVVVVGHTRLLAAMALGLEKVPVHIAADLSPEEAKAYRIADNRTGEETEWDTGLLSDELKALGLDDFDLSDTGFDEDELQEFLQGSTATAPEDFQEYGEDIETEHKCPKCGYEWSGRAA